MKPEAFLINTARGGVIDEEALIQVLSQKRIAGAGLDVFEKEPPDPDNPLLKMDNVVLSPHAAALTKEASIKMSVEAAQAVVDFFEGIQPKYIYNLKSLRST